MKVAIIVVLVVLVLYVASGAPSPTTNPATSLPPDLSVAATGSTPVLSPANFGGRNISGQNQTALLATYGYVATGPTAEAPMGVKHF